MPRVTKKNVKDKKAYPKKDKPATDKVKKTMEQKDNLPNTRTLLKFLTGYDVTSPELKETEKEAEDLSAKAEAMLEGFTEYTEALNDANNARMAAHGIKDRLLKACRKECGVLLRDVQLKPITKELVDRVISFHTKYVEPFSGNCHPRGY